MILGTVCIAAGQAEIKLQKGVILNIVIGKCLPILKLLAIKGEPTLVLDPLLDLFDCVSWIDVKTYCLATGSPHVNVQSMVNAQGCFFLDTISCLPSKTCLRCF